MFRVFSCSFHLSLVQGSQLNPELADMASLPSELAPGRPCFCLLNLDIADRPSMPI